MSAEPEQTPGDSPGHSDHNKHNKDKQEPEQSDCEDCQRERQQNRLLINMYEKLKNIEGKVERVQTTLKQHIDKTSNNLSNLSTLGSKLQSFRSDGDASFVAESVGLELASELIERRARKKLEDENRQLRQVIAKMRQEQSKLKEEASINNGSTILQVTERTIKIEHSPSMIKAINNPEQADETSSQYLISRSSQFMTKRRQNEKDPAKRPAIPQLSLWLFDSEENSRLESQLYSQRPDVSTKNESYFQKKKSGSRYAPGLPTIRQHSDSKRDSKQLNSSRYEQHLPIINRRR